MNAFRLSEILQLPVAERLDLVEASWDSIADAPEVRELSDAQRAELDHRLEEYERNPTAGSPWHDVKARILERS